MVLALLCDIENMASSRETLWKENILQQLKRRNRKQGQLFQGLIQSHNKLFENAISFKTKNIHLAVETAKLKEENITLQIKAESGGGRSGSQLLFKLQEELTELHRKRGEIIDVNNAIQEKEKELRLRESKLCDAESHIVSLIDAIKLLEDTILELEATNQMLKEEHRALQLAYAALEEKYIKVQEDNGEFVARLKELKLEDAAKLNDKNAHSVNNKQEQLKKELEEAAKKPVVIIPAEQEGLYLSGLSPISLSPSLPSKAQYKFDAHEGDVNAVRWSPSGKQFATGGADRKIKLWEYVNGKCEHKGMLLGSNAGIMALDFDFEETLLLGASNDCSSRVWSLSDFRLRHTLSGHCGKVLAAKFLGFGTKVVSGSYDRTLKVWDLQSKTCIKTIFAGSSCNDLITLNSTDIISGHFDRCLRFWDSRSDNSTNKILLTGRLTSLDLSPDRHSLLCCTRDDTLKVLDLRANRVSHTLCDDSFRVGCDWSRVVFSPDGAYAVAGSADGALFIWNINRSKVERVLREHSQSVVACSWHPSSSLVVSCEKQKKAILWSDS